METKEKRKQTGGEGNQERGGHRSSKGENISKKCEEESAPSYFLGTLALLACSSFLSPLPRILQKNPKNWRLFPLLSFLLKETRFFFWRQGEGGIQERKRENRGEK